MKEGLKHIEIFEEYLKLGNKRTLTKLSEQFHVSIQSLMKWSKEFHWTERVEEREKKVTKQLEKRTDEKLADIKSRFRIDTQEYIALLKKAINQTVVVDEITGEKRLNIEIEKPVDLEKMLNAFDKLVKLDLLLAGETGPEEKGLTINFIQNNKLSISQEIEKDLGD